MSRDKIIEAAAKVFSKQGYFRTSMDEIAQAAGVAKGTLYYHFPSKSQLFKVLITEGLNMMKRQVTSVLNSNLPIDEQLKKVIWKHIQLFLEYSELAHITFNEISSGIDDDVLDEIQKIKNDYISFIADLLRTGYIEGYFYPFNYEIAASGIIGMLDGVCRYLLKHPDKIEYDKITQFMYNFIFSGIMKKE